MENTGAFLNLKWDEFQREGLYLIFPDGSRLSMVKAEIERLAQEYWRDPEKISEEIKKTKEFQPCGHCPHYGEDVLCKALTPMLPYVDHVDKYMSYDKVTAVFREADASALHVSHTTMQQALKYMSFLSLLYYCEMGDRYQCYLKGVIPIMAGQAVAARIYSNMYLIHKGDDVVIEKMIVGFRKEVLESTRCLVKRLRLICKNDAFINAFVNTQVIMDALNFKDMLVK